MGTLTPTLYEALTSQQFLTYFNLFTNSYFPFGSFWWLTGFGIAAVIHLQTKNFAYTMAFVTIYFVGAASIDGLITDMWSRMMLALTGIVTGIILGWYVYQTAIK